MATLRLSIKRLRDRWLFQGSGPISSKDLIQRFQPDAAHSMRSLLTKMNLLADLAKAAGGSTHPYYRRSKPMTSFDAGDFASDPTHIDLKNIHLPAYNTLNPVEEAVRLFDARAAAAISAATGIGVGVRVYPSGNPDTELLEEKEYEEEAPTIYIPKAKCLAALAYSDFFPNVHADNLRLMVAEAILAASPGWCGTFGPGVDGAFDVASEFFEGDYDMSQMHLLPIAYRNYDELPVEAREHLITALLARGRIHRPGVDDTFTSEGTPNDWSRAGFVSPVGVHIRIGETENHILMIITARYLTNQLLYQRNPDLKYDNRRNGEVLGGPHCTKLVLTLLRNILRDDFSEYNAKPYQTQTRSALLNLCSYAYDHEVRLAARMVLDYISAHYAVSSNDLRRMVPFRRRNESELAAQFSSGFMDVGLLEWFLGADPTVVNFAMQAGNTRAYQEPWSARPWEWAISGGGNEATWEVLSDYRLPSSIHDLFVNDLHRRFFQRLHRVPQDDGVVTGRNCDNHEIYAGSPSYLITAGGSPAPYAIDPSFQAIVAPFDAAKQLGVAVTTSFMPTGRIAGPGTQNAARDLIQFSCFSDGFTLVRDGETVHSNPPTANYGVAPDFACGHQVHLPLWVLTTGQRDGQFLFVDRGTAHSDNPAVVTIPPGYYLAIYEEGGFSFLEAFDTWLHPGVTFQEFKRSVKETNPRINLLNNVECQYTTHNGNRLHFVIWKDGMREGDVPFGARILRIEYGDGDPMDRLGDAGNITDKFLRGTVMNSLEEGLLDIQNHFLGTKITLDMRDQWHPSRTAENGEVEQAGFHNEVWVNFGWTGLMEGDFFRPFNTIEAAAAIVADGGVIKIMPGWTNERPVLPKNKRIRIVAPIGDVKIGVR